MKVTGRGRFFDKNSQLISKMSENLNFLPTLQLSSLNIRHLDLYVNDKLNKLSYII